MVKMTIFWHFYRKNAILIGKFENKKDAKCMGLSDFLGPEDLFGVLKNPKENEEPL